MSIIFFFSTLSIFLFYFALAFFFLPLFFQYEFGFGVLVICMAAAFLGFLLRERKYLRFLPLTLLGLLYFSADGWVSLVLMAFPVYYVVQLIWKNNFDIGHTTFHLRFSLHCKILGVILLLAILLSVLIPTTTVLILCLAYFICGITLLRLLRHEHGTLQESGFVLMNFVPGAAFVFGITLFSTDWFALAVITAFRWFWLAVYYVFYVPFVFLVGLLGPLFSWLTWERRIQPQGRVMQQFGDAGNEVDFNPIEPPDFGNPLVTVIAVVVAVLIVLKCLQYLHRLMVKWRETDSEKGTSKVVEAAVQAPERSGTWFPLFNRPPAIRRYYRRFLKLCMSRGIEIPQHHTSADIQESAREYVSSTSSMEQLRRLYIRARYGGEELSKEDEQQARMAYRGIREVMKR